MRFSQSAHNLEASHFREVTCCKKGYNAKLSISEPKNCTGGEN